MLFYFFSLFAAIKTMPLHQKNKTIWKVLSLIGLVLSALSYEVVLPLYLINMIILWNPKARFISQAFNRYRSSQSHLVFIIVLGIAMMYLFIFKALTTTRFHTDNDPFYLFTLLKSAIWVNYGVLGMQLPRMWGYFTSLYATPAMLICAIILLLGVFWYTYFVLSRPNVKLPGALWMRNLTVISIGIFLLGYAIFFFNNQIGFSPTGIENRVAFAAAIGIAFTIIGLTGLLANILFAPKIAKIFFSVIVAIVCAGNFLTINSLALFWEKAYDNGQIILADIHREFPVFPKDTTLILDGVCPYNGPAPVFEAEWDLKGAMQMYYHDASLNADIVTPRLQVKADGIQTQLYGAPAFYTYKNLIIYNYKSKTVYTIPNQKAAKAYFKEFNPDYTSGCPIANEGSGVAILPN
jgi:hypothetical protein